MTAELALLVADQVAAGDVHVDAERRLEVDHAQVEGGGGEQHLAGNHPVAHAALRGIDIGEEGVEGAHALDQSGLDRAPFRRGDHARQDREGEDALGAGVVLVDREGDAPGQHLQFRALLSRVDVVDGPRGQPGGELGVGGARLPVPVEHLIRPGQLLIRRKHIGHGGCHPDRIRRWRRGRGDRGWRER